MPSWSFIGARRASSVAALTVATASCRGGAGKLIVDLGPRDGAPPPSSDGAPGAEVGSPDGADEDGARPPSDGSALEAIIWGNVEADRLPKRGSAGFVLIGRSYRLFMKPGAEETALSHVSADGRRAYGWYRQKSEDPGSPEVAIEVDLVSGLFTTLPFSEVQSTIVRGGSGAKIVGRRVKAAPHLDASAGGEGQGFVYDLETEALATASREGQADTVFTALNGRGVVVGFSGPGERGFVYERGAFLDLTHPDADRLLPLGIDSRGTIVGLWGRTADGGTEGAKTLGFVARKNDQGAYDVARYDLAPFAAAGLTGINDRGAYCGIANARSDSYRTLVRGALGGEPEVVAFPRAYEPFPAGIRENGWIYGQVVAVSTARECAGHGVLAGEACACDFGYELDAFSAKSCVGIGAPCSGHGHEHAPGLCHCEQGAFQNAEGDPSRCVPL